MDLSLMSKNMGRVLSKNSPTILSVMAVAGLITTVVFAVKATPKAVEVLEYEKKFREEEFGETDPLSVLDTIETAWKCYIPTFGMGVLTIGCIVGANHINLRRNAALASVYTIATKALEEYQAKVVETIGEKKEEMIRGEIAQDHLDQNPVQEKTLIITGKGNYLCFDEYSKRYFRSDIEAVRKAENIFNQRLLREGWLGVNDFYEELGLDGVAMGDQLGWIAVHNLLELKFSTKLSRDTNEPCLVIDYYVEPHHI